MSIARSRLEVLVLTSNGKPVAGESLRARKRASETESLSAVMTVFGVSRKLPAPRTNWTGLGTIDTGLSSPIAAAGNMSNGASNDNCRAWESFSDGLISVPPEEWPSFAHWSKVPWGSDFCFKIYRLNQCLEVTIAKSKR
jgi:hypothetical protein